jgi:hypothetical protein
MTDAVGNVARRNVEGPGGAEGARAPSAAPADILPTPDMEIGAVKGDVMSLLYAMTAGQRDATSKDRATAAERKSTERKQAFEQMRAEIQKAKEVKEEGGWLATITDVLDAATDAVVGGNPLQDVAHRLAESTGIKQFEIAYDIIRPDALMHGAAVLTSAATGCDEVAQTYDAVAGNSSLKTRFQGGADISGDAKVMDAYAITRDGIAATAVTVGTCGVGTVAVVAIASSAALMIEAKADLLGKLKVGDEKDRMWIRLGAQASVVAVNVGGALAGAGAGAKAIQGGAKVAVSLMKGADLAGRGSVQVGQALYEDASNEHLQESAKHQSTQRRADRDQQRIISGLREIAKSYERSLGTIASAMNQREETSLMLARNLA